MLSDSGTLTLETKDTICEDDIEVEYTKPEILSRTLEIKVDGNSLATPFIIQGTPGMWCDFSWEQIGVSYAQVAYVEEFGPDIPPSIAVSGLISSTAVNFYMPDNNITGFNVVLK